MPLPFFITSADRWPSLTSACVQEPRPVGQPRRAVILFSFSFQTDCIALGVRGWWSEAGAGGLIMAPYMAELVNTELSPGQAFPGAEKLPKFFLSPALPWVLRPFGALSVRERWYEKSRRFLLALQWCPGLWWSIWPPRV